MASNLDIKISITTLSQYGKNSGITASRKKMLKMIESFSEYVLELYGRMIEEAIYSNRYQGFWEPTDDEGYREYLGTTPSSDIILLIRESLEVKKVGSNFLVRFSPTKRYPGSKLTIGRVVRAIDSGTTKFTARPIFSRILRDIRSSILRLWRGYLVMKGVL